jgi:hypothetical protein
MSVTVATSLSVGGWAQKAPRLVPIALGNVWIVRIVWIVEIGRKRHQSRRQV